MKTLVSMTDFVIGQIKTDSVNDSFKKDLADVRNYALFLKQSLTLGMFVAVDKHGNITEPLKGCCSGVDCGCMGMPVNVSSREEMDEVLEAESKVLFKDCEVREIKSKINYFVVYHKSRQIWISWTDRIIEDLILNRKYLNGLELTESAIKQIFG